MAAVDAQTPTCPVCKQADQVKTLQAAYESGVARTAPPDMPTRNIRMLPTILGAGIVVGIFVFLIVVLIGSEAILPPAVQIVLLVLTLLTIVGALVTSYVAFQRVVKGDAEATERFPAWDRATAVWKSLDYCSRDDVVFDPKTNKVISNDQLAALRTMEPGKAEQVATTLAQST
jgi:hypothetical protein